jgi:hypothetical protein
MLKFERVESFVNGVASEWKNYCEAVIRLDGLISAAIPSHVYALIEVTGESMEELNKKMPTIAAPCEWLCCYTGCVSVWHNSLVFNKLTKNQVDALSFLQDNGLLGRNLNINCTCEKLKCEYLNTRDSNDSRLKAIAGLGDRNLEINKYLQNLTSISCIDLEFVNNHEVI